MLGITYERRGARKSPPITVGERYMNVARIVDGVMKFTPEFEAELIRDGYIEVAEGEWWYLGEVKHMEGEIEDDEVVCYFT